jgi:uncharacterized protein YndB with AHSA1/START domain
VKHWILRGLALLVLLVAAAYVAGLFIPRDHVAALQIDLKAPPERVWSVISDIGKTPEWRTGVSRVEMQPQPDGKIRFTESSSQGDIQFEVLRQDAPVRQVVRVVDDEQPFGGIWTWDLGSRGDAGTRLTITEAGFIKSPLFRTMGIFFFSPTETIDTYLRDLARRLGEDAAPAPAGKS